MATVKALLSRERVKKCGGYALVIQILHKRHKRVIYLGYTLNEANFDNEKQRLVYCEGGALTRKQIRCINECIELKLEEIVSKIELIESYNPDYTVEDIISKYRQDRNDRFLYIYIEKQIREKQDMGKFGIAKAYRSTMNSLKKYTKNAEVQFSDMNFRFVKGYENYLFSAGVVQNTVSYYLRNLRTFYNKALNEGVHQGHNNSFRNIHIRNTKTVKRSLHKEVIQQIAQLDLSDNSELDRARDFFMFSFYTRGMSFVDIILLHNKDIVGGVIYYKRQKTNQQMQVKVTAELQLIIDKYRGDDIYVLPFINQTGREHLYDKYRAAYNSLNHQLKKISSLVDIDTPLTTYVARHSWATIAKESGAAIATISQSLGHTTEKTTVIYLREFDNSIIDNLNSNVINFSM